MSPSPALISAELAQFMRGPVSAMLGTSDAMAVPDATRVAGVAALDGRRLRVLIPTDAQTARANAVVGARVAVLVTNILTYRSVQWKGRVVEAGMGRTPGDLALFHRHLDSFCEASQQVGIPRELVPGLFPVDVVPLVVEADALYDQTPGPGAGRQIGTGA